MPDSKLKKTLDNHNFAITAEIAPPKGTDFKRQIKVAKRLMDRIDAFNVTDFQSASVKASSLGLCIELIRNKIQPVLQITGRDRNRIAVQGELLTASHFGIENILCLTGDHPSHGDNPEAKPVFELESVSLLNTARSLENGVDLGNNQLDKPYPEFYLGAVTSPVYTPLEVQLIQMVKKIKAGAQFFQTQAVFDIDTVRSFIDRTSQMNTNILIGVVPLKSAGMARFMNREIPGIKVPENLIKILENSNNPVEDGIKIASDFIIQLKDENLCQGVHIMAIGAEENIEKILNEAKLN